MKRWIGFALVAALAMGCGKKDEDEPAPTDDPPVETPPADKPADTPDQPAAAVDEELPTVEDFEEEAADTITESNLEKELADLEKEIGE